MRASLVQEAPETLLQQGILRMVLHPMRDALPADEADRRVQLVLSQLVGLVVTRYLLGLEPLASMPAEDVVAWVAPTLQRYLDGPLPTPGLLAADRARSGPPPHGRGVQSGGSTSDRGAALDAGPPRAQFNT